MKNLKSWLAIVCICLSISCSRVPITKRSQLNLLPESMLINMSLTEYNSFLSQHPPVSSSDPNSLLVAKTGNNISQAVERFMRENKMSDRIKGYKWEYKLVNENAVNAWCMPGGKVVVYSGILPITQDETGLAVVMGHEIAHAIAQHGNERMSQMLTVQAAGIGIDYYLQKKQKESRDIFMTAYGVGSTLGVLAYSRTQESEADKLGLVFMAMAGYDPNAAVGFWQRMAAKGAAKPPEFLSTHPSDERRIREIKKYMPQAMKYYKK